MALMPRTTPATGFTITSAQVAATTLRVFSRTPQLVMLTVIQQLLFLLVFRYVFGGAITTQLPLAYIDYMAPGIVVAGAMFAATGAAAGVAQDRSDGFFDRLLSLPGSRAGLVVGRAAADTTVVVLAVTVTIGAALVVGFRPQASLGALMAGAALVGLFALTFAFTFGALGALASGPAAAQAIGFVAIPLTFVSSAYVPTDTMPNWLALVAEHQPVTHMVDALRGLVYAGVVADAGASVRAATSWCVLLMIVAGGISLRTTSSAYR